MRQAHETPSGILKPERSSAHIAKRHKHNSDRYSRGSSGAVDAYARRIPAGLLTREQERDLSERWLKGGDLAARNALVVGNLKFAMKVAHQYVGYGHPLADLIQEANLGMLRAAYKFDPLRGFKFITYAVWWIHAALRLYVMHQASLVKFGTTQREREAFVKLGAVLARLRRENPGLDRDALLDQAATELSLTSEETVVIRSRLAGPDASLDVNLVFDRVQTSGPAEGTVTRADCLTEPGPGPEEQVDACVRRAALREAVRRCAETPRERFIVEKRLLAEDPLTLQDLGDRFGVSRERVRQLEEKLMRRLGNILREHVI